MGFNRKWAFRFPRMRVFRFAISLYACLLLLTILSCATLDAAGPSESPGQETVFVPEQVTTYRLVFETSFEEKKQVRYHKVWKQEWKQTPYLVTKPIVGYDGQIYMQNVRQMQSTPVWTFRWSPQESVENVPQVKAFWKPYTTTRLVAKQVPAGTPAPPANLDQGNNGGAADDTGGNGNPSSQDQAEQDEIAKLKDELQKLEKENEHLKEAISKMLGTSNS